MHAKLIFRLLIVLTWLLPLISAYFLDLPWSRTPAGLAHSAEIRNSLAQMFARGLPDWPTQLLIVVPVIIVMFAAAVLPILLWRFHPIGRIIYIPVAILYVWSLPLGLAYPPNRPGRMMQYVSYASEGALAAMMFLPPITGFFMRRTSRSSRADDVRI